MWKKNWFCLIFLFTLILPVYGKLLDNPISLSGVTASIAPVERNIQTLNEGTYQTYLRSAWEADFPGRKLLLCIRNQLLYSLLNVSPNQNIVIGKENYLFEPEYIIAELQICPPTPDEYFSTLGNNLLKLKSLLKKNGKELYVFITPSKAHFYREYIPDKYFYCSTRTDFNTCTDYERFLNTLEKNNINYYDSIKFINEAMASKRFQSPLYYKSGIHWSHPWGEAAAAEFLDYIRTHSKYDLNSIQVTERLSDKPIEPDTDLYSALNLLKKPNEQWWASEIKVIHQGKDHPNVFLRGGSFMGQSLNALIHNGVFGKDVHFENNYYFQDNYSSKHTISKFDSYNEINIDMLLGQSDIVILEVNERAIPMMNWGFIEHLLEHPEYLDYDY